MPSRPVPRMESYVASLPRGLASYPEAEQKASVYREFLAYVDAPDLADSLPPELAALVRELRPMTSWVPEVQVVALYLAICDVAYPSEDVFVDAWLDFNKTLLSSPLYRFLMMVASPERILKGATSRWEAMHRGVGLELTDLGERRAKLRLAYPAGLLPELICRGLANAFQAAVVLSGGDAARVTLQDYQAVRATFEATW